MTIINGPETDPDKIADLLHERSRLKDMVRQAEAALEHFEREWKETFRLLAQAERDAQLAKGAQPCRKCEELLLPNASFCRFCGTALNEPSPPEPIALLKGKVAELEAQVATLSRREAVALAAREEALEGIPVGGRPGDPLVVRFHKLDREAAWLKEELSKRLQALRCAQEDTAALRSQ